jgi:hypothetical protein
MPASKVNIAIDFTGFYLTIADKGVFIAGTKTGARGRTTTEAQPQDAAIDQDSGHAGGGADRGNPQRT